jgi:4-hydroxybenzoate polyprenyltransferase
MAYMRPKPLFAHTREPMSNVETKGTLSTLDMKHKIPSWVKTMRVQTALVTSLALWVGYISVNPLNIQSAIVIGVVGVLFHIYGFTMNEVKDRKYDSSIDNDSVHPIAEGKVDPKLASHVAWGSYFASVLVSMLSGYSPAGSVILAVSVIPAYAYNRYSKTHWWSNIYLSIWASMMVLSGALHAGQPNQVTALLMGIVAIQTFVQVMQGDLKDLTGDEKSVCRILGVTLTSGKKYANKKLSMSIQTDDQTSSQNSVVIYTKKFVGIVYSLKFIELGLLAWVSYTALAQNISMTLLYGVAYFSLIICFVTTLSMFMVYVYQRSKIKKYSSMHELTWVLLIGLSLYTIDPRSGVLVGVAPVIWYLVVNKVMHSGSLNPDI